MRGFFFYYYNNNKTRRRSEARREDTFFLVIQDYSTGGEVRLMKKKKERKVSWDLHVYVVCQRGRYLGIVAAEEEGISISKFTDKPLISQ